MRGNLEMRNWAKAIALRDKTITTRCGLMLSLGMGLPRKITGQNYDTTCTCVDVFCVIW